MTDAATTDSAVVKVTKGGVRDQTLPGLAGVADIGTDRN